MTDNYTNKDIKYEVKEVGDVIHLMEIYLTEWCHRDSWLWKQMYNKCYPKMDFPNCRNYYFYFFLYYVWSVYNKTCGSWENICKLN